jgi:hypothetical protein
MKKLYHIILFILYGSSSVYSQDIIVTAAFDSSKIFIGDQINFTVTVEQPKDINIRLPFFKDTLIDKIEILKGPVVDTVKDENNRLKIIEKYLVTSFDSGLYQVPPVYAEIGNKKNLKRYFSDYSQLEVARVRIAPPDTTARIFDIVAPYKAPLTFAEVMPWLVLGAVIAATMFFVVRSIRKMRKDTTVAAEVINIEPAHVIAIRELDRLKGEQLWQKGEIKKYYTRITEILRQYLGNRYGITALELTTAETLAALTEQGFKKDETYKILADVLRGGDLVKFAKYKPVPEENEMHLDNAYRFVEATRIIEKPQPEEEAAGEKVETAREEGIV